MGEVRGWIGAALGSPEAGAFEALAGWSRRAGLPGLVAMGLDPSEAEAVAEDARGSSSMRGNPVELDAGDLRAILEAAA
jgi:alcohol dehydrogenase class IV